MKKISIKTFYLLMVISIGLIGLAVGSTYAMFTASAEIDSPITINSNLTSNDDVMETFEVEIEPYKTITKTININNGSLTNVNYAIWYLNDITDVDIGVVSTDSIITGIIKETNSVASNNIVLRNNSSTKKTITLGVAISNNSIVLADNMTLVPKTVIGERTINTNAATYITKLYSSTEKKTVTNNSITYNTSPSQLLMNDRKGSSSNGIDSGNIRYYGASPDNYVYFNCSDYSNPTSSTCEIWRIIGVFDGKVKIIRSESVDELSWDNSTDDTVYGTNAWESSRLMKLLNQGYTGIGGSLYYNSKSGTCYSGTEDSTISCTFTNTGIKNDETKNMISESTFNLGAGTSSSMSPNGSYNTERGVIVTTGNSTTWIGKVALMYLSDYGYAADFNKCSKTINNYNDNTCKSNNYLYNGVDEWVINHYSGKAGRVLNISSTGGYSISNYANEEIAFRPVVYLNPDTIITTGEGTKDSPYKVKYNDGVKGEYFNGVNNYMYLDMDKYDFKKSITMVARFKIENYDTGGADIIGNWETAGGGLTLYNGVLYFNMYSSSANKYIEAYTPSKVSLNVWHTAVGVYDGSKIKLFLDGVLVSSVSCTDVITPSTAGFMIGANPTSNGTAASDSGYFNGYIADAIVFDEVLSDSDIISNYGKNYNSSYSSDYILLKVSTGETYTLTKNSTYRGKYFNGTSDYVNLGNANRDFSNNITVVARYRIKEYTSESAQLISNLEGAGFGLFLWNGEPCFNLYDTNSSGYKNVCSDNKASLNKWHIIVGTYDGTTMKLYHDGSLITSTDVSTNIKTSTAPFAAGVNPSTDTVVDGEYFKGLISDVGLLNTVLSANNVSMCQKLSFSFCGNNSINNIISKSW